jgi:hypothetical protein
VLIPAWVVYFSAVNIMNTSARIWRQVNVAMNLRENWACLE